MRTARRKLRQNSGFTLTEALIAVVIVGLIGIALASGIPTAMRVYTEATQSAEAGVLSGTLVTAIEDELRYATDIEVNEGNVTFTSSKYGRNASFVNTDGRVRVSGKKLIGDKAYTSNLKADIVVAYADGLFTVTLEINNGEAPPATLTKAEFSVRPLN